ncbi:MAG: hypothetical protein R2854_18460 [Caldilineaceae bacterium]
MNGSLLATAAEGAEFDVLGRSEDGRWLRVCCVTARPATSGSTPSFSTWT